MEGVNPRAAADAYIKSLGNKPLEKAELREAGKLLSSRAGAWEALKYVGFGFAAKRHFQNKAVMYIRSQNMGFIQTEFALNEPNAKALAKQDVAKYTLLTSKEQIAKQANTLKFLECVKDENHWAHDMFSDHIAQFSSLTPEKALRPNALQVADTIINNWDELDGMCREVDPSGEFKAMLTAAGASGGTIPHDLMNTLRSAVPLYQALPAATPDRGLNAVLVNTAIVNASRQQGYSSGVAAEFRQHVTEKIRQDGGFAKVLEKDSSPVAPIACEFNRKAVVAFTQELAAVVGEGNVNSIITAVMSPNVGVGTIHYTNTESYENFQKSLEPLMDMKKQCDACGIGEVYGWLLSSSLRAIGDAEPAEKLQQLSQQLGAQQERLQELTSIWRTYENEGMLDSYERSIAVQVRSFDDDVNANSLDSVVNNMRDNLKAARLEKRVAAYREQYGEAFANLAHRELGRAMNAPLPRKEQLEQSVQVAAQTLETARGRFVHENGLTQGEFKEIVGGYVNEGYGALAVHPEGSIPDSLAQLCNKKITEKAIDKWAEDNGGAFRQYLADLIQSDDWFAEVLAGNQPLTEHEFWTSGTQQQQEWVAKAICDRNPHVPRRDVHEVLFREGDAPLERRLAVIGAMNGCRDAWTPKGGDLSLLDDCFVREMADPYLVDGNRNDVNQLRSYAISLAGKKIRGTNEPIFRAPVVVQALREELEARQMERGGTVRENLAGAISSSKLGGNVSEYGFSDREKSLFARCVQLSAYEYAKSAFRGPGGTGVFGRNEERFARDISARFGAQFGRMEGLPDAPQTMAYVKALTEGAVRLNRENGLTSSDVIGRVLDSRGAVTFSAQSVQSAKDPLSMHQLLTDFIDGQAAIATPLQEATVGQVLDTVTGNIGGTIATGLRETVHALAPNPHPRLANQFEKHLAEFEAVVNKSSFQNIDLILDKVVTEAETRNTITTQLSSAKAIFGAIPVVPRRQVGKEPQSGLSSLVNAQFDGAKVDINSIVSGTTSQQVEAGLATKPSNVSNVIGIMMRGIRQARIDKEASTLPGQMPPFSAVFLYVLPKLQEKNELIKGILGLSTSFFGRALSRPLLELVLKMGNDLNLSAEQKDIVFAALPLILDIAEMLKLKEKGSMDQFNAVLNILNTIEAEITAEEPSDPVVVASKLLAVLEAEKDKLAEGAGDILVATAKGIFEMGQQGPARQ